MATRETIIGSARKDGRIILTEIESKQIIEEEGIKVIETRLAKTKQDAISIAGDIGYPVAMKVVSSEIVHKSDSGGVKLGLANVDQVEEAYDEIMAITGQEGDQGAGVDGVAVQSMADPGVEVIMGMSKDAQFGPVLMFGLGGVFVEVLKDVAFRIVPIAPRDARQMVKEIKGYPVLEGYRGQEPSNVQALEEMLLRLSNLVEHAPEIKELDLNPVFACSDGAIAVDARIILEPVK